MKYRKKPVVIEAIQFTDTSDCLLELGELGLEVRVSYNNKLQPVLLIPTLEGTMTAQLGDFIIKGVNGEFYPCKPDIFEKTYDLDTKITAEDICILLQDDSHPDKVVYDSTRNEFYVEQQSYNEYIVENYGVNTVTVNRYVTPEQLAAIATFYKELRDDRLR